VLREGVVDGGTELCPYSFGVYGSAWELGGGACEGHYLEEFGFGVGGEVNMGDSWEVEEVRTGTGENVNYCQIRDLGLLVFDLRHR
jgi:hypothetical protein